MSSGTAAARTRGSAGSVLRFLGGLDGIGKSALLARHGNVAVLVDCGVAFAADGRTLLPDPDALAECADALAAVFLTHAHYDHAGAAAFIHEICPRAVFYASRETIAFLRRRYALPETAVCREAVSGEAVRVGDFVATPLAVGHSVPGALAWHLAMPDGTCLVSGDFREPPAGAAIDALVSGGLDLLVAESTNAALVVSGPDEDEVAAEIAAVIAQHVSGKILVSCFSSNLRRIGCCLTAAFRAGLPVHVEGEALVAALAIGRDIYRDPLWDARPAWPGTGGEGPALILASGCQGEDGSRLMRFLARRDFFSAGDAIVLSASAIPGNEAAWRQMLELAAATPAVIYAPPGARVHASGHAALDGLMDFVRRAAPRTLVPCHGSLYQRRALAERARQDGIAVLLPDTGDALRFGTGTVELAARAAGPVPERAGYVAATVAERKQLAARGLAIAVLAVAHERSLVRAELCVRGFFRNDQETEFLRETARMLEGEVLDLWSQGVHAVSALKRILHERLVAAFETAYGASPLVAVAVLPL